MKNYRYQYNCVNPLDTEELFHIIDNNIDITYNTFLKHVNKEDFAALCEELGYSKDFHIKNDWHVSYHRAKYEGETIYFMCHSAIEYIFKAG
jgi:hypothetical protein